MFFKNLKKTKKQSVLQLTAIFLAAVFAIVMGACPTDEIASGGSTGGTGIPHINDYTISTNLQQTVGSVTAVIVIAKANKSPGAITVYYTGDTDAGTTYAKSQELPQTVGTYIVSFDVEQATAWSKGENLIAGRLVIDYPIPVATDFNIGNLNQKSNAISHVTITPREGKSNGAITIYYNGSTSLPTTAGSFPVTFDVAATATWQAAQGLSTENLIIGSPDNQTPVASDYTIGTNLTQTAGSVTAVNVTATNGKSSGTVTVHYEGKDGTTYTRSATVPQEVGYYAVTFDVAAATGWNAANALSAGTTLTVKGTPVATDFDISNNLNQTFGSVTAVTVTPKAGKSQGARTVKYNGSTSLPTTAGSFPVTFDVVASGVWNAATALSAGTLTISNLTPVATDYEFGNLIQTLPSVIAVTVTAKTNKSPGAVSNIKYANSTSLPTTAGTYAVTFDVAAATGWNSASNLSAGTLTINAAVLEKNYISGPDALSWGTSTTNAPTYLGLTPGNDSTEVRLSWQNTTTAASKVRFIKGKATAGTQLIEVTGTAANPHKVTVTGLEQGASYQYAVSSDGNNWSALYDFKVTSDTGTWKFALITDPQINTNGDSSRYNAGTPAVGWKSTMDILSTKGISLIASQGDQTDTAGSATQFTSLFAPDGIKSIPMSHTMGNHDVSTEFFKYTNLPNETGTANNTGSGANYYYRYNNVLFVVLNTANGPTSKTAAATYIGYFEAAIDAAKAAHVGKYDWIVVQHHKSTASVASHAADTDIQYYVEAGFEKVMSDKGVDFVVAGHDHVYARSYPLTGLKDGQVSVPDKTSGSDLTENGKTYTKAQYTTSPGKPIYLTFTTASGLKYYGFPFDKEGPKGSTASNGNYPYLGDVTGNGTGSTAKGSTSYASGNYKPVSTVFAAQPWIPSYTIAEVTNNGKTIRFSTYTIVTLSGTHPGGSYQPYSYNKDIPYDVVEVTKQ